MDQAVLVSQNIGDGEKLLALLLHTHFDPVAACWIKDSENQRWSFYVASGIVDQAGPLEAYRRLHAALAKMPNASIESDDINVISARHPIAREVQELQQKYPAPIPTRFRLARLGDVSIEEAYIYPPTLAATSSP